MKVLFICNQNKHRSKTAEEMFKGVFETRSKGIFNNPFTKKDLEWADLIVVMEDFQRKTIADKYPDLYLKKKIVSLDIPDVYSYAQPELKSLLKTKMKTLV
jgi:predicted protein tyrosine phosphatase